MSEQHSFNQHSFVSHVDRQEYWIHQARPTHKKLAIVVTFYNELANANLRFAERLTYYQSLAQSHQDRFTLFLVDDGSTDGSTEALQQFVRLNSDAFNVMTMPENRQKVGAYKTAISMIDSEYILLADFDTDLVGLEHVKQTLTKLDGQPDYMGCTFKMLPVGDSSKLLTKYYQLNCILDRISHRSLQAQGYVVIMHGAGSIYRRTALQNILSEHSGFFDGDDTESTLIGYRLGYKAFYEPQIQTLTRIPSDYLTMHKQLLRWRQGHLRARQQERDFLLDQIARSTPFGENLVAMLSKDVMLVCFPFTILALFVTNKRYAVGLFSIAYFYYVAEIVSMLAKELREISDRHSLLIVPILPLLWLLLESPAQMWVVGRWLLSRFIGEKGEKEND